MTTKYVIDPSHSTASFSIKHMMIADAQRDAHLKSADFFDVEKYPLITFKSSGLEKTGEGLSITGDLTIHGVTK